MNEEVSIKLGFIRDALTQTEATGVRLRGTDWFAWATGGASNTVLLTAETGVAEVLITHHGIWILTDEIEAQRLQDEELSPSFLLFINPWEDPSARENFVREVTSNGKIISDRPFFSLEKPLTPTLQQHKRILLPTELDRYRKLGQQASESMTEVLQAAKPDWTEYQLAGAGAEALWKRGIHPALTLVAGDRRLPLYRHAIATEEKIGKQAMVVFCARKYGLYANLTRFVHFGKLSEESAQLHRYVREIEAEALSSCQARTTLDKVYFVLAQAYKKRGFSQAIQEHHQGGTTGYLAREIVATPDTTEALAPNMAIAWNPSLRGAKIEDTFVLLPDGNLENLTFDANFPSVEVEARSRPIPLEK